MKYLIFLLFIFSCDSKKTTTLSSKLNHDNCLQLKSNEKAINKLLENEYARKLSDSFIKKMYLQYGHFKLQLKGNPRDSIYIADLIIAPYVMANPYGDSSTFDLIYFITDENCTRYYDSLMHKSPSMIHGMRFSIQERKILCFITFENQLVIDSSFIPAYQ